jgi:hypothetical protein
MKPPDGMMLLSIDYGDLEREKEGGDIKITL